MDKILNDMIFNLMCDLKKRDLDPIERAKLLTSYMADNKLSGRELARELGIPKSTLEDWTRWTKITKEEYDGLIEQGYTHTDIYRGMRQNTEPTHTAIDVALRSCIVRMSIFKLKPPYSKQTKGLIKELEDVLLKIKGQLK